MAAPDKPETERFHVYGKDIDVETEIEYDASLNTLTLQPGQILLRDNLFLMEYVERNIPDEKLANQWMYGILHEIIHLHCRTDPDVILSRACPNFEEYLINLAQEMAKVKAIPYVNDKRIKSKKEVTAAKQEVNAAKQDKKKGKQYGAVTLTFTILLKDITGTITDEEIDSEGDLLRRLYLIYKQFHQNTEEATNVLHRKVVQMGSYDEDTTKFLWGSGFPEFDKLYHWIRQMHGLSIEA